jgi:two-component sensor histidine kinase
MAMMFRPATSMKMLVRGRAFLFGHRAADNLPEAAKQNVHEATKATIGYSVGNLLSAVALVSLLPLVLLGSIAIYRMVQAEHDAELARISSQAATLARAVQRELRGHIETAEVLSGSRSLVERDLVAFGEMARDAAAKAGGHFILMDRTGQQLINTRLLPHAVLPRTNNPSAVQSVFITSMTQVSNLAIGAVAQQLLFAIYLPISLQGEVSYVLAYVPRTGAIRDLLDAMHLPAGSFASVIDGNGRIVARSHRHDEFFGQHASAEVIAKLVTTSGIMETVDLEGRRSLTAYHLIEPSSWTALIWTDKARLEQRTEQMTWTAIGLLVITASVSLLGALLVSRAVQQPMLRLHALALALGEGKPIQFEPSMMQEANVVGSALTEAANTIAQREQVLKDSERHTRLLMQELTHRSKNLLAIILAIARQTGDEAVDIPSFQKILGDRVEALARSHDLLIEQNWRGVGISELVRVQLAPFSHAEGTRFTVEGPPLTLRAKAAESIGLALHELATNATKYGSLSVPEGQVEVTWALIVEDEKKELRLRWKEMGGPSVAQPSRRGFGRRVIERVVPAELRGTSRLSWIPDGLEWVLQADADEALLT